jgi:hypothetical protein
MSLKPFVHAFPSEPQKRLKAWRLAEAILPPAPKLPPDEWARVHRVYPETSGLPVPRDPAITPYIIPVERAMHAGAHKRVVMVCGAQMGKTDGMLDIMGARLDQRPDHVEHGIGLAALGGGHRHHPAVAAIVDRRRPRQHVGREAGVPRARDAGGLRIDPVLRRPFRRITLPARPPQLRPQQRERGPLLRLAPPAARGCHPLHRQSAASAPCRA